MFCQRRSEFEKPLAERFRSSKALRMWRTMCKPHYRVVKSGNSNWRLDEGADMQVMPAAWFYTTCSLTKKSSGRGHLASTWP